MGNLYIQDNSDLTDVDLSSLECVNDFTIEGNDLDEETQYELLVQLTCASEDSLIVFRGEDADDWCALGETEVENLYINALGSDPIDLSCIETITGYLEIENSIAPSIDLSGVISIDDEVYIHENDDLESIDLSALQSVDSYVYIYNNSDLETVTFDNLEKYPAISMCNTTTTWKPSHSTHSKPWVTTFKSAKMTRGPIWNFQLFSKYRGHSGFETTTARESKTSMHQT